LSSQTFAFASSFRVLLKSRSAPVRGPLWQADEARSRLLLVQGDNGIELQSK
jgi:hypothetical protein